jgi:hypothetical protein
MPSPQNNNVKVFDWLSAYLAGKLGYVFHQAGTDEQGVDIGVPVGTPIGSISSGKIVNIDSRNAGNSIGYVVQVQDPVGGLWHYQHLASLRPGLAVGQNVSLGDVLAYSGGCATYKSDGSGCASVDANSSGPHIEVRRADRWNPALGTWQGQDTSSSTWVNPQPSLNKLAPQIVNNPAWNVSGTSSLASIPTIAAPCNDAVAQLSQQIATADPVSKVGLTAQMYAQYALCSVQQSIISWGEHIAIFVIALLLIVVGLILLAEKQVTGVVEKAVAV